MPDVPSAKLGYNYLKADKLKEMQLKERNFYLHSLLLYFDEDDRLKDSRFRKVTLTGNETEIVSYPLLINLLVSDGAIDVRNYTYAKFERLNAFLSGFDKIENTVEE